MLKDDRVESDVSWAACEAGDRNGQGAADDRDIGAPDDRETGAADDREIGAADDRETGAADDRETGAADKRAIGATDFRETGAADKRAIGATDFREIDRQLRALAKRRAALDSEEARWLREAEAHKIWRKLGFSTALEYLEDVFGYAPRTALERLRVAKELGTLEQLDARLRSGELSYAAARELSRVMTPRTERAWLARARGKNLRSIEELVAGHKKGDGPDDPKDPDAAPRVVSLRLAPASVALLRQTRADLSDECGHHVEDDELIEILCRRAREGAEHREGAPAPAYQVSIRTCDQCGQGAQLGGGRWTPIDEAVVDRATCDAIEIGDEADLEARGSRTIPKKVRDHVWLRDGGGCRVPGCRATRNCDLHHVVHWAHGGTHDPSNLVVICSGHHKVLHEGLLSITGQAPDALVFARDGKPLADARPPADAAACNELRAESERAEPKRAESERAKSNRADPKRAESERAESERAESERAGSERAGSECAAAKRTAVTSSLRKPAPSRYASVASQIEARAALRKLGYQAEAAKEAVIRACAHVGADAEVATIVVKVRELDRSGPSLVEPESDPLAAREPSLADKAELARQALVTSGFKKPIAQRAVAAALRHVPKTCELQELLREALRHCLDG